MTIKELQKRQERKEKDREALTAAIMELSQLKDKQTEAAEKAAEAGNIDDYKKKIALARDTADTIYVKEKLLEKAREPEPEEEVREAWAKYSEAEMAKIRKDYEAYRKARTELSHKLREIMEAYRQAGIMHKQCADLAGLPSGALPMVIFREITGDYNFFCQTGDFDRVETSAIFPANVEIAYS